MDIQRASLQDVATLAPVFNDYRMFYEQESDVDGANRFLTERLKQQQSVIFYALHNGQCAGFTQLYPTFSSIGMQKAYILNDLYVAPQFRRQKIAEQLMQAAFDFAKEENARYVTLETMYTNVQAQALYEKIGMTADADMKHYAIYF